MANDNLKWNACVARFFDALPMPDGEPDPAAALEAMKDAVREMTSAQIMAYRSKSIDRLRAVQAMRSEIRDVSTVLRSMLQSKPVHGGPQILLPEARA